MADKRDDDSGLIDVRTISVDDGAVKPFVSEPPDAQALKDFHVMVKMAKEPSPVRFYVVVAGIAVLLLVGIMFAMSFLTEKTDKRNHPAVAQTKTVEPVSAPMPLSDTGETIMSNVNLKVQPRPEDGRLNVEVTLPGEQRLFYVCEPRR